MSKEIDWSKAPEGATHYGDEENGYLECWYRQEDGKLYYEWVSCLSEKLWLKTGCRPVEELIARPVELIEWTGQGLPPVGTVCEFYSEKPKDDTWHDRLENGAEVRVIAHYDNDGLDVAAFTFGRPGDMHVDCAIAGYFRPIRIQAQIEAEEREKAVSDMMSMWMDCGSARDFCEYLHDHGYRKTEVGK